MIELKKLGSPDWSLQEELNSIRDIPKLFEYYCLLLTKRSLDNILNNYIPPCNKPFNNQPYPQPCVNIRTSELIDIQ